MDTIADMKASVTHVEYADPVVLSFDLPSLEYPKPTSSALTSKTRFKRRSRPMNKITSKFQRRKSSSNVLELAPPAPSGEPSFRVLSRPPQPRQVSMYDNNDFLAKPPQIRPRTSPNNSPRRPYSYFGDGSDLSSNRGSGNTNNSNATTVDSQKRFSYASTEASSVDDYPDEQGDLPFPPRQKYEPLPSAASNVHSSEHEADEPQSRKKFSLKAAGRTFSFGSKSAKNITKDTSDDIPPLPNRDRSMTASSYASTATPPKLDLGIGNGLGLGDSGFGDLLSKRKSTIMEEPMPPAAPPVSRAGPASASPTHDFHVSSPEEPRSTYLNYHAAHEPLRHNSPTADYMSRQLTSDNDRLPPRQSPAHLESPRFREAQPGRAGSPYSFRSGASEERLMSSPRQELHTPDFGSSLGANSDSEVLGTMMAHYALEKEQSPQPPRHVPESTPLARTRPTRLPPSSYRGAEPPRRSPLSEVSQPINANTMSGDRDYDGQSRAGAAEDDEPLFDAPRPRRIFRPPPRSTTAPSMGGKVMTPAEFEQYKKHKENAPPDADNDSGSSSEEETYEDDDETERQKEAAKQRRKQEAHLAVYRQQMMKVTGEQPSELPSLPQRAPLERSTASAPSLHGTLSFEKRQTDSQQSRSSREDEDEDEEVPLGVLQAHGFPNKNRPPTRTSSSAPTVTRLESQQANYPAPGGTTRNDATAGGGGNPNLPVFAKNLPQDPYVGASLVNGPSREPMNFNHSHGSSSPAAAQPPNAPAGGGNLPPGGLVGVIASEERAKALRRGSPNARGTYDPVPGPQLPHEVAQQQMMQQMMQQQMPPQAMPHSSAPQTPMSPGEHSQLQVADQMTKMMQMQMQFMQWAMQNQGQTTPNGSQTPSAMFNGMQSPQLPSPNFGQAGLLNPDSTRTFSMASAQPMPNHQRVSSNMSQGRFSTTMSGAPPPAGGYAPSIAPSERSVVGQPSRYRPVTPGAGQSRERESRTSSISQQTIQALRTERSQSRLRQSTRPEPLKSAMKSVERPRQVAHDDDDDDEGWAEMQKQRQARQSRWKQGRTQSAASLAPQGGLEGLYYEGPQQ